MPDIFQGDIEGVLLPCSLGVNMVSFKQQESFKKYICRGLVWWMSKHEPLKVL